MINPSLSFIISTCIFHPKIWSVFTYLHPSEAVYYMNSSNNTSILTIKKTDISIQNKTIPKDTSK